MMKKVKIYTLTTCIWCKKTKAHMEENHIPFEEVSVDTLSGEARAKVLAELEKYNPNKTFPTIIVGEKSVVIGFKIDEFRKAFEKK